jgi:maltose alpha-D-glucosyltransferase/alpha-amylase
MEAHPLWYKSAIVYQLHVRVFFDSNADGFGDFRGLTQKLDYIQRLGVTAVWLLPFYPSPLKDDGYDISDYRSVHANYGRLGDFRTFLREAHRRGLRVITELVLNHTSDQHPWFQRARRAAAGSRERDYYVWSDTSEKYQQARVIFRDYETSNWSWDPVARAYYWHRFFHHQPDLNYDNPEVQKEITSVLDHWLRLGVDGLRLDGVPYLFEREGTSCENLPETHAFLKKLRAHVDSKFSGRMFLAEANQWPEDAVAYFGDGDECHTAFHFPLMPRMYMALQMEDRFPIIDILEQTPAIPENCQWMLFLRNHDELTLEMVSEHERDSMYRFYARDPRARLNLGIRRRLAPLLENDRRKIELLHGLLLSLPGTPVLYYGDEIGMGDNIYLGDRNGVRTPMQWSADRNASFSQANPQRLYLPPIIDPQYHYETVNVETQRENPNSLLSWMQRVIRLRGELRPLAEGALEFLYPENAKVLAFLRRCGEEHVLVVANLSRFAQFVELNLSAHCGKTPVEAFGRIRFPRIGDLPYLLTLTPYAFYWFVLQSAQPDRHCSGSAFALPVLKASGRWETILEAPGSVELEQALPDFVSSRPWHRRRAELVRGVRVSDVVSFREMLPEPDVVLVLVGVEYQDGDEATYVIPLGFSTESAASQADSIASQKAVARLQIEHNSLHETGIIYDAFGAPRLCELLLEAIATRRVLKGDHGKLWAQPTTAYRRLRGEAEASLPIRNRREEQSNSVVAFGDRFSLKLFRRMEEGTHPELEMGLYLTEKAKFAYIAPVAGSVQYKSWDGEPMTVGMLQAYVAHERTAWDYTLATLESFLQAVSSDPALEPPAASTGQKPILELAEGTAPSAARRFFASYLHAVAVLGQRTAELHAALAAATDDPAFAPEPLLPFHQRSLYQSMRNSLGKGLRCLRKVLPELPPDVQAVGEQVLRMGQERLAGFRRAIQQDLSATRIRCHGNYGLEDVLCCGDDYVIVDFEGDPDAPLSQRRAKSSPLRDVAGMLWSVQRAGEHALREHCAVTEVDAQELARLRGWIEFWIAWTSAEFVRSYLAAPNLSSGPGAACVPRPPRWGVSADAIPAHRRGVQSLLDLYFAERCALALERDLENRPRKSYLSLQQMLRLLETPRLVN